MELHKSQIQKLFLELRIHNFKMSHEGKMFRGESYVGREGLNESQEADLKYFLENQKQEKVKEEVKETKERK